MLPAGPGLMLGLWQRDGVKPPPPPPAAARSLFLWKTLPRSMRPSPSGAAGRYNRARADRKWISATLSSPSIRTASACASSRRRRTERAGRRRGSEALGLGGRNWRHSVPETQKSCYLVFVAQRAPGPRQAKGREDPFAAGRQRKPLKNLDPAKGIRGNKEIKPFPWSALAPLWLSSARFGKIWKRLGSAPRARCGALRAPRTAPSTDSARRRRG